MTTNLKKLHPHKLNLDEMYQVYIYLKDGTPDPLLPSVMDNVRYMLSHVSAHRFSAALKIFYTFEPDQTIDDHLDFLILFINAVRKNHYFEFVAYMRKYK